MKTIKFLLTVFSCLAVFMLVSCGKDSAMFEKDYYVKIGENEQTPDDNGEYVYILKGFDKSGKEKVVTFFVDKPFKKGTIVRVPRSYNGHTGIAEEIKVNGLPQNIKKKATESV
ncbi:MULTISPECIES: YxeA family protein [unclassified Bacillus (in: firmicutes)]|uniref:YxeA family protein n=1 Tax=unclassified Bacillus (in: firmicutes) TaxID=185979 RepID=UPI001BE5937B|nr:MULTISPECIES: YxeA family protein [unclassified Bacillus (in: firmicutes)]MBT2618893.1 YxeA family protein [Bacillus sp. ISL-78]MBT2627869.1 YxeA family protein [Bacillus sp. ISL-101]